MKIIGKNDALEHASKLQQKAKGRLFSRGGGASGFACVLRDEGSRVEESVL